MKIFADGSEHSGRFRCGVRGGPGVYIDSRGQKTRGNFHGDIFGAGEDDGIVAPVRLTGKIAHGGGGVEHFNKRDREYIQGV